MLPVGGNCNTLIVMLPVGGRSLPSGDGAGGAGRWGGSAAISAKNACKDRVLLLKSLNVWKAEEKRH
jgi:hypothetical protein